MTIEVWVIVLPVCGPDALLAMKRLHLKPHCKVLHYANYLPVLPMRQHPARRCSGVSNKRPV
jgi:hypothetical protein